MKQQTQRGLAGGQIDPSQIDPSQIDLSQIDLRTTDRRRVARYTCSGHAQITCLPLNGALLRGRLRDLGLGGCRIESIETTSPFDLGARTEILVKVNSWFFRAMAHVRAVRGQSAISVEFMRMSAGGYSMLAELIADLERPRHGVIRNRHLFPAAPPLLTPGLELNHSAAIVGTIVPAESADLALAASRQAWFRDRYPGATSVDLFA
jgi:hypothetical protein